MILNAYEVGFTGTQQGMTYKQIDTLTCFLRVIAETAGESGFVFHHGDCIGADEQAHDIALKLGFFIVIHPPENPKKRAFCLAPEGQVVIRDPKPYIARNHDIVDETFILFGTPKEDQEVIRSGTWSTLRYAKDRAILIYPSGEAEESKL